MTQEHPITPPPELVKDWAQKAQLLTGDEPVSFAELLCNKAVRWGADQELEACCEWLVVDDWKNVSKHLRAARRPKPPSLKEQALEALDEEHADMGIQNYMLIRSVLESLPD